MRTLTDAEVKQALDQVVLSFRAADQCEQKLVYVSAKLVEDPQEGWRRVGEVDKELKAKLKVTTVKVGPHSKKMTTAEAFLANPARNFWDAAQYVFSEVMIPNVSRAKVGATWDVVGMRTATVMALDRMLVPLDDGTNITLRSWIAQQAGIKGDELPNNHLDELREAVKQDTKPLWALGPVRANGEQYKQQGGRKLALLIKLQQPSDSFLPITAKVAEVALRMARGKQLTHLTWRAAVLSSEGLAALPEVGASFVWLPSAH